MYEFWTIPSANMMYARLQNYTNMMVDRHEIQTFEIMSFMIIILLLSFNVSSLQVHIPHNLCTSGLSNILKCQPIP